MIPGNKDNRDGYLFALPFLIVFILFMIYPLINGFYISFFKWDILSTKKFLGLDNYVKLFKDQTFYTSLWHTFKFVLITTPILLVLGFIMALFVNSKSPFKKTGENIFFLPYIFSMTVVSTLWAWLFQKQYGLFNHLLSIFNIEGIGWLTDPSWAMWSVSIATFWWTAGFNMILLSAGIKQISKEVFESAEIDGASYFQRIKSITIPLIKPTIVLCLILQVIASFNVFGQVYVMTGGGPYGKTRVLIQYIYESGFQYFKMGYSAAMSYILFLIILVFSLGLNKLGENNNE
ncbi:MAG: sugar ABC transporter permease [Sphaerochaetaceae bacterium]|nr:sugar ABC transporter permease [Sphaerochaetaceae bacterium]